MRNRLLRLMVGLSLAAALGVAAMQSVGSSVVASATSLVASAESPG